MQVPDEQKEKYQEAENEILARAGALEQMTTTQGWSYMKAYIQNKIQAFANEAIITGYKSLEEFNLARGQVNALRQLVGEIDEALEKLNEQRQKASGSAQE